MILTAIDEAQSAGARLRPCCEAIGLDVRTIQRWRRRGGGEDGRRGPAKAPSHALSTEERERIVEISNSAEFCDLSPKQIVPQLADQGEYVASESSFYRVLRAAQQLEHREPSKPRTPRPKPREYVADGPNQVWSWDITYLRGPVRGQFYFLYLFMDIWSRKIVGWDVHEQESMEHSADLLNSITDDLSLDPEGLVVHSDNGSPMKGATMRATMERLGVIPSFSRPSVSDDNPYSEALFRTMKYCPEYPRKPFGSIEQARAWVAAFVGWYNNHHLHSAIGYVTPDERHDHRDIDILERRHQLYQQARLRNPARWSGNTRSWKREELVRLNPADLTQATSTTNTLEAA